MSPSSSAARVGREFPGASRRASRHQPSSHPSLDQLQSRENTVLTGASISVAIADGPDPAVAAGEAFLDALHAMGAGADELPCRVEDADLWFAETPAQLDRAKGLCLSCPVRELCLAAALARHEPWGVWGGAIFDHGVVVARKRPRGRPRKESRDVVAA